MSPSPSTSLTTHSGPGQPPIVIAEGTPDSAQWVRSHSDEIRRLIAQHGVLVVRGLNVRTEVDLRDVVGYLSPTLLVEKEAFASREAHPTGIYSSSAWPAKQQMCMHHELSYRLEFPGLMAFAYVDAPTAGGSIATADSTALLERLPQDLVARLETEGWILQRNYSDEIGLSIADAFGTDSRSEIEQYCRTNVIGFEWTDDGGLRTNQRRPAVVYHQRTRERCWFNQIAFLSEWTLNPEVRAFFIDTYGADGLPFNTQFGNGDPLSADIVATINDAYDSIMVSEPAIAGDLTLVDNVRTAHGREPYEGPRQVVVAMADPVRITDVAPSKDS